MSDLGSPGDGSSGSSRKPSGAEPTKTGSDVVLIHGVTEDGKGLNVLRARDERIEIGQVRPLEEGKPLAGDVVRLKPRAGAPYLCDVETELSVKNSAALAKRSSGSSERSSASESATPGRPAPAQARRHGPPQVASDAYRRNWDAIWKSRDEKPRLPN